MLTKYTIGWLMSLCTDVNNNNNNNNNNNKFIYITRFQSRTSQSASQQSYRKTKPQNKKKE